MPNIPTRTNNPGDLKFIGQQGASQDPSGFAKFNDPKAGFAALLNDIQSNINKNPKQTLADFANKYAPASDGNNPAQYAANLANKIGMRPDSTLGEVGANIGKLAEAISSNEGYQAGSSPQQSSGIMNALPTPPAQPANLIQSQSPTQTQPSSNSPTDALSVAGGVASKVTDALGLHGAVDTIGNAVAGIAHPQLQSEGYIPTPTPIDAAKAGTSIGLTVPAPELGAGAVGLAKNLLSKTFGKDVLSRIVEDVTPTLTKNATIKSLASKGASVAGTIGKVVDPYTRKVAAAVAEHVPGFTDLPSYSEKLNAVLGKAFDLASQLKERVAQSGQDVIYPFKELSTALSDIAKPIEIEADPVQSRKFDLARQALMRLAQQSGGKISGLFDASKGFRQLVEKEFPNLWDKESAPMRSSISSMNDAVNEFIETHLPKGSGFRDSLKEQSLLFKASDALAPRAYKEVGKTAFQVAHPMVSTALSRAPGYLGKGLIGGALGGLGIAGGERVFNDLTQ